jgi:SPASM domain peptide maturase of grasp-with-spasm system
MSAAAPAAVFRLHAHCIPVRGARRSTLCDLQRRAYHLIPNGLYEILTAHRDHTRAQIHAAYAGGEAVVDEYFAFLVSRELGWWCDEPERFPAMDMTWEVPARVTNAIVDVDDESRHDYADLVAQLEGLGCQTLQLRLFAPRSLEEVETILGLTDQGRLRSVELLLPWTPECTDEALFGLCRRHPRLLSLFVHGAPERRVATLPNFSNTVVFRTEVVGSEAHCGEVHPAYFVTSLSSFSEALAHNSCLNRKLSVDRHGDIRNCPAMPRSFGNAAGTPLAQALEHPDFREWWGVTKDQVETCRDCEFRYVCTDCRAHVRDPADRFSKPARCAYDPYEARWDDAVPAHVEAGRAAPIPAGAAA